MVGFCEVFPFQVKIINILMMKIRKEKTIH
jgi:hypothetical protein